MFFEYSLQWIVVNRFIIEKLMTILITTMDIISILHILNFFVHLHDYYFVVTINKIKIIIFQEAIDNTLPVNLSTELSTAIYNR